jgi:hypothetical protein
MQRKLQLADPVTHHPVATGVISGGGVVYKDYVQNLLACELAQLVNIPKRVFPTTIF